MSRYELTNQECKTSLASTLAHQAVILQDDPDYNSIELQQLDSWISTVDDTPADTLAETHAATFDVIQADELDNDSAVIDTFTSEL